MTRSKLGTYKSVLLGILILVFASSAVYAGNHIGNPPGLQNNPSAERSNRPAESNEKLLIESRGNRLKIQLVTQSQITNEEEELDQTDEVIQEAEVEELNLDDEGENGLKIRANNNASLVIRNRLAAQTNFPLRVNLETNELIVNTPNGEKIVTILPDQAVANMLAANVLDQVGGKGGLLWMENSSTPTATVSATPTATASATPVDTEDITPAATESASPTEEPDEIEDVSIQLILTDGGVLAYEIEGEKEKRFLGLFKVNLKRVVFVSAETGELINIQQSFLTLVLDALSI